MPAIAERLTRLQMAQTAPESAGELSSLAPAFFPLVATLTLLSALAVALIAPWVLHPQPAGSTATAPAQPSTAAVAAKAKVVPHQLYGDTLEMAGYVPASATKQPAFGAAGIILDYRTNGKRVEVYEFRDPSPTVPLIVDPAKQAPATPVQISGVSCLVWTTPDRSSITQLGFKTSDGLVIYVLAQNPLTGDDATSLVARLKAPPTS